MHRPHLSYVDRQSIIDSTMIRPSAVVVGRFFVVLFLSVIVATIGLLQNSTAVVIGAMMMAPLMSPIIGISASIVLGWGRSVLQGAALVLSSVIGAVIIALVIALVLPQAGSTLPTEVLARTSPDVRDLVVALAAGAAGSYALIHRDISGALPGVAVAVALVPPLASVGVLLGRGQPNLAIGAGLLFVTNLFGIILAGGTVLVLAGFVPAHALAMRSRKVLISLAVFSIPTVILGILLTVRFIHVADQARNLRTATTAVVNWLGPVDEVNRVAISGSTVEVNISGRESPPTIESLTTVLTQVLGRPTTVDLRWTPVQSGQSKMSAVAPLTLDQLRPLVDQWLSEQSLQLDGLTYDSSTLSVSSSGNEPPKSADDLASRIATRFGTRPLINLNWIRTPLHTALTANGTDATSVALTVAHTWATTHPGVFVLNASQSESTVTVTLFAKTSPNISDLKAQLQQALPHLSLTVQWVPGTILDHSQPSSSP